MNKMPFATENQPRMVRVFVHRFFSANTVRSVRAFRKGCIIKDHSSCPLVDISQLKHDKQNIKTFRISKYVYQSLFRNAITLQCSSFKDLRERQYVYSLYSVIINDNSTPLQFCQSAHKPPYLLFRYCSIYAYSCINRSIQNNIVIADARNKNT